MSRPDRCQVCGRSTRKDGERLELEIGNRCGQHSGKWMCLSCFLRWTDQKAPATRVASS